MSVADFFAQVRSNVKRGTSLDADIQYAFKNALNFMQQNYSWDYMRETDPVAIASGEQSFLFLDTDTRRLKSVILLRYMDADEEEWKKVARVEPQDIRSAEGDFPAGYTLTRETTGWRFTFDCVLTENMDFELFSYKYQLWNGDEADTGLWLVENATNALLARTMVYLAPVMRDATMLTLWNGIWLQEVSVLINEDEERKQGAR